ncbi:DUF4307 domain-containing protein [Actinoplanes friuliensis]|uniref:DUF4307 domain-containing protein n=1 Tax=Actinoplanes friuliensis TaxID=196914 RepID=UPI00059F18A8|nr:DUF4307 domain-containing protein [Actinoplanes friuliensis]
MSETRATTPVFPPGRYGWRRDGRRRLFVPIVLALVFAVGVSFLATRLYSRYGSPDYDSQIVGWSDVTDSQMKIEFTVRVPAGASATCGLRARSYDGAEVGRATVTVKAQAGATTIEATEPVPTTAKAAIGEVVRCAAAS